jgi:hypothetical protein
MATPLGNCGATVSTFFVFDSPSFQTGAETIYVSKKDELASSITGRVAPGARHDTRLIFASDYERMKYLMGLYGRTSQGRR